MNVRASLVAAASVVLAGCPADLDPGRTAMEAVAHAQRLACALPAAARVGLLDQYNESVAGGIAIACSDDERELDTSPADVTETTEQVIEDAERAAGEVADEVADEVAAEAAKD